jgi:hypothetical protein
MLQAEVAHDQTFPRLVAATSQSPFTPATANRLYAKHTPDSRHSRPTPRSHFWRCVENNTQRRRGDLRSLIDTAGRGEGALLVIASAAKQSRITVLKHDSRYLSLDCVVLLAMTILSVHACADLANASGAE